MNVREPTCNRPRSSGAVGVADRIAAIFQIDGRGCDVVLFGDRLSWTPLSGEKKAKKSGSFLRRIRGKREGQPKVEDDDWSVNMSDVLGVSMKRRYNANRQIGVCVGVSVYTYRVNKRLQLEARERVLEHPSEELCLFWISRLQQLTDGFKARPRSIKVFLQSHAGLKDARFVYNQKVLPLLEAARIKVDLTDVQHNEQIKQDMIHMDVTQYDSIVCLGGDGTANTVINELLVKVQKASDVTLEPGCCVIRPSIPVGIIPLGTTNDIVHSVQGTADVTTAVIHIILGHRISVDICSVYHEGKFVQFAFNSHYGFFGNVTKFLQRYSVIGEKKTEMAIIKALTTSKFRSYECEIGYIPAYGEDDSLPCDHTMCCAGCEVCSSEKTETTFLQPLGMSNTSSGIRELGNSDSEDSRWVTVKADLLSLSVMSIAGLSEFAPLGMGKYTHLADGCVDLMLVRSTDRKQFLRYLRRHASSKNQFDLPFVECHRCEEVRVRVCPSQSCPNCSHSDTDARKGSRKSTSAVDVIEDLEYQSSDTEDSSSRSTCDSGQQRSVVSSKISNTEKSQRSETESRRAKDEAKRKSVWSVDHQLCVEDELHFRLHPNALFLQGLGVPQDYAPKQVAMSYLSMF